MISNMVMREGVAARWNTRAFPEELFEEHISPEGSSEGLTWLCNGKDVRRGTFVVIIGPKGSDQSGIVAAGYSLGTRFFGFGLTGGKEAWRIPVELYQCEMSIEKVREILGEDIEDDVQSPKYLNAREVGQLKRALGFE